MPNPTEFESHVFRWIRVRSDDVVLRRQLEAAEVVDREHTGVGCYSRLRAPADLPLIAEEGGEGGPLDGPRFEAENLEHGGGTLLWLKGGRAYTLEVYTYDETFPQDHRDLGEIRLMLPLPASDVPGSGK